MLYSIYSFFLLLRSFLLFFFSFGVPEMCIIFNIVMATTPTQHTSTLKPYKPLLQCRSYLIGNLANKQHLVKKRDWAGKKNLVVHLVKKRDWAEKRDSVEKKVKKFSPFQRESSEYSQYH